MVRNIHASTRSVLRRGHVLQQATEDFSDAVAMLVAASSTLGPTATNILTQPYIDALNRYTILTANPRDSSPIHSFSQSISAFHSTILAILSSLSRPSLLVSNLSTQSRNLSRNRSNLASTSTPKGASKFFDALPGSETTKERKIKDLERKIINGEKDVERLGRELAWTREVVVGELAGWNDVREKMGREAVKRFVRGMVVRERERGRGLERLLRTLRESKLSSSSSSSSSSSGAGSLTANSLPEAKGAVGGGGSSDDGGKK